MRGSTGGWGTVDDAGTVVVASVDALAVEVSAAGVESLVTESVETESVAVVSPVSIDGVEPHDATNVTAATRHRKRFAAGRRMSS